MDAVHGAPERRIGRMQRANIAVLEVQTAARTASIGTAGRRSPRKSGDAHTAQDSRVEAAVARSRHCEAIAERNAAEGAEQGFLLQLPVYRGSFEPCGPQPCPAEARKHPAVAGRAPQAAPAPLRLPYFVILSVSEGSIWGKVTDSSSIFRSPQNDNAVFALNHFRSGTHSSARPGRLRGSHLRCEPAPGARSSVSERERACGTCLP